MRGAIAASIKKNAAQKQRKSEFAFYTPARYGWGQIARSVHPRMAQV